MTEHDYKEAERHAGKSQDAKNQALNTLAIIDEIANFSDADMETVKNVLIDAFYEYAEQARKETAELFLTAVRLVEV